MARYKGGLRGIEQRTVDKVRGAFVEMYRDEQLVFSRNDLADALLIERLTVSQVAALEAFVACGFLKRVVQTVSGAKWRWMYLWAYEVDFWGNKIPKAILHYPPRVDA